MQKFARDAIDWNPALKLVLTELQIRGAKFEFEETDDPTQLFVTVKLHNLTCFITPDNHDYESYGGFLYADRQGNHNKMGDSTIRWCIYNTDYDALFSRIAILMGKKNPEVERCSWDLDDDRKDMLKIRFDSLLKSGKPLNSQFFYDSLDRFMFFSRFNPEVQHYEFML